VHEVLFKVGSWSFSLSAVEVLFHTCIACFFPFIVFVKKACHGFRIFSYTFVSDRIDFMIIIFGPWDKLGGFPVGKITFLSVPHSYSVEIISFRVTGEKAWIYGCILMRHLFLNF